MEAQEELLHDIVFVILYGIVMGLGIAEALYLQHDLSLTQLAKTVGTNHYYLSQYFSRQGLTYNAYINGLRIRHFMSLYEKAVVEQRASSALQFQNLQ